MSKSSLGFSIDQSILDKVKDDSGSIIMSKLTIYQLTDIRNN